MLHPPVRASLVVLLVVLNVVLNVASLVVPDMMNLVAPLVAPLVVLNVVRSVVLNVVPHPAILGELLLRPAAMLCPPVRFRTVQLVVPRPTVPCSVVVRMVVMTVVVMPMAGRAMVTVMMRMVHLRRTAGSPTVPVAYSAHPAQP